MLRGGVFVNLVEQLVMMAVGWFLGWWFSENTRVRRLERENYELQRRLASAGRWTAWKRSISERKYRRRVDAKDVSP